MDSALILVQEASIILDCIVEGKINVLYPWLDVAKDPSEWNGLMKVLCILIREFFPFFYGGCQLEAHFLSHIFFNFESLSANFLGNILNFPKHHLHALF